MGTSLCYLLHAGGHTEEELLKLDLHITSPFNTTESRVLVSLQEMFPIEEDRRYLPDNVPLSVCIVQLGLLEHISVQGRGRPVSEISNDSRRRGSTKLKQTHANLPSKEFKKPQ